MEKKELQEITTSVWREVCVLMLRDGRSIDQATAAAAVAVQKFKEVFENQQQ